MRLEHIKMTISALWIVTTLLLALVLQLPMRGAVVLGCLGLFPPLLLMLLWKDPAQTLSESIDEARR